MPPIFRRRAISDLLCGLDAVSGFPERVRQQLPGGPIVSRSAAHGPAQPSYVPAESPFELRENCQQAGHGPTGRYGQIERLRQRDEPDTEVIEFLERGASERKFF